MIIPLVVLTLGLIALGFFTHVTLVENQRLQRDVNYYRSTYLRMQGCTSLWSGSNGKMITYDIRSFDGGKKWYAVEIVNDTIEIKGKVDVVYPGLMDSLKAWDAIVDRAIRYGPLHLSNASDVQVLTNAGVQIVPAH